MAGQRGSPGGAAKRHRGARGQEKDQSSLLQLGALQGLRSTTPNNPSSMGVVVL